MPDTLEAPRVFNPRGQYIYYTSEKRGGVYLQNGVVFAENHTDLEYEFLCDEDKPLKENFLSWLNRHGFTMDYDFRRALTRAKFERQHQENVERSRREMLEREQQDMERMELELKRQLRKTQSVPAIPPMAVSPPPEPIELTELEKEAWGDAFQTMFPESVEEDLMVPSEEDEGLAVVSRSKIKKKSS